MSYDSREQNRVGCIWGSHNVLIADDCFLTDDQVVESNKCLVFVKRRHSHVESFCWHKQFEKTVEFHALQKESFQQNLKEVLLFMNHSNRQVRDCRRIEVVLDELIAAFGFFLGTFREGLSQSKVENVKRVLERCRGIHPGRKDSGVYASETLWNTNLKKDK